MSTAWLFAGQGSQRAGMGKDLYEKYPAFKREIDLAAKQTDFDLKEMMFEAEEAELSKTKYTQPILAAFAAGTVAVLKESGKSADYLAGLSLGEYSALHAAGVFDTETLIKLTAFRGDAMQRAGEGLDTLMCAVLGMEASEVEGLCEKASEKGQVTVANYNATGQYVVSGEKAAVKYLEDLAKEAGAKRCMELKVSSAFHTSFMEPAKKELEKYLDNVTFGEMKIPVIFNTTGRPLEEGKSIREMLERQIVSGVRMEQTIKFLASCGVTNVIEIGPGRVLSGFIKRTAPEIISVNVDSAEDLAKILEK